MGFAVAQPILRVELCETSSLAACRTYRDAEAFGRIGAHDSHRPPDPNRMSNFRPINRDMDFLMPPSVDEWLPQRHLARFVAEVIEGLDLRAMTGSYRGSGEASYHPRLLLGLIIYGYATGVFSSRNLERATYDSVAFRFIAANEHPDHDTIANLLPAADRGAVRSGARRGPRDGGFETWHGGTGRHQDPRQCQPPQRAVLCAREQDRGATEG